MTQEPRYLIVNADDFGYTDGVTEGILRAWKDGIVTSTSAMINMPGAPERVARARQAHPELPIGLHLNITRDEYLEAREVELNVLLDPRVREALDENQIQLADFGELKKL